MTRRHYRENAGARLASQVNDYASAERFLGDKPARKIANNTYIVREGADTINGVLHHSAIITWARDGRVRLDSHGYRTVTTKARLNTFLEGTPWRVVQERREWYVWNHRTGAKLPFEDGDWYDLAGVNPVTRDQLLPVWPDPHEAREFHRGYCTREVGPRGGVVEHIEVWRRSGKTQTWKTRPGDVRVPIKYGFYGPHDYITQDNMMEFHVPDDCPLRQLSGPVTEAQSRDILDRRTNPRARTIHTRIPQLIGEGYPDGHGQAGAIAYREARGRGERVPAPNPHDRDLLRRMRFFQAHAGGVVGETAKTAIDLARAERAAVDMDWEVTWEPEPEPDLSWMDPDERMQEHVVEMAVLRDDEGNVLASLGNIVDADDTYRRVVNAELACEANAWEVYSESE